MAEFVVIEPDQRPVKELRRWLSDFATKNRSHYEKGKIGTAGCENNIKDKSKQLEVNLCSSTLSTSSGSSIASPIKNGIVLHDRDIPDFLEPRPRYHQHQQGVKMEKVLIQPALPSTGTDCALRRSPEDFRIVSISSFAPVVAFPVDTTSETSSPFSGKRNYDSWFPDQWPETTPADLTPLRYPAKVDFEVPSPAMGHEGVFLKKGWAGDTGGKNAVASEASAVELSDSEEQSPLNSISRDSSLSPIRTAYRKYGTKQEISEGHNFKVDPISSTIIPGMDDRHGIKKNNGKINGDFKPGDTTKPTEDIMANPERFHEFPNVSATVKRLGCFLKPSTVQLRRQELERKWAEDRVPTHTKKVSWQASKGTYKKKVVLKVQE